MLQGADAGPARLGWIDAVRGGAVLLVVCFHAATLMRYADLQAPTSLAAVNGLAAPFRMPTLVFLSGLFLAGSLRKGATRYFAGKFRMIGWPYLVWASIFFALSTPVHYPLIFLSGGTWLWFLVFLMIFYVLAYVLKKAPTGIVLTASFVASLLAPDDSKWGERFFLLFAFFMAGHWVATHERAWKAFTRSFWVLGAAAATLALYLTLDRAGLLTRGNGYNPATSWASAAGLVIVLRAAQGAAGTRWTIPLQWAGRHSLIFYVTHFPVMYVVVHIAARMSMNIAAGPWITYTALLISALGCAFMCAFIAERESYPRLQWLFTWSGENKRRCRPTDLRINRGQHFSQYGREVCDITSTPTSDPEVQAQPH